MIRGQLNTYLEEVISKIMQDQELLKMLYYVDITKDIDEFNDLDVNEKIELKKHNIFRFKKVPSTDDNEAKIYLCVTIGENQYFDKRETNNKFFFKPKINFYIICHSSLENTEYGNRTIAIEDRLMSLFHYEDVNAIGTCHAVASGDLNLPSPYVGRSFSIALWDANNKAFGLNDDYRRF